MCSGSHRLPNPAGPAEIGLLTYDLRGSYTFYVHHDARRRRLRSWWATGAQGVMSYSEMVWRARTREKLVAKLERFARRDMLERGMAGSPKIEFIDRSDL